MVLNGIEFVRGKTVKSGTDIGCSESHTNVIGFTKFGGQKCRSDCLKNQHKMWSKAVVTDRGRCEELMESSRL